MKVILNKYGESISPQQNAENRLSFGSIQHGFCCGFIYLTKVSKTHQAFYCQKCNFRFVFPREVDTWTKLKQFVKENKK